MPLIKPRKGASKKTRRKIISQNISELGGTGRPQKQKVAIALDEDRKSQRKRKKKK